MSLSKVLFSSLIIIFHLFALSSGVKIYVKPEGHKFVIRIFCGQNRENLILESVQRGVQNELERGAKKFLEFDRNHFDWADCNEEAQEVIIDVLYFKRVQTSVLTTVGHLSSGQKLVIGMPGLYFATKTFTIIESLKPEEKVAKRLKLEPEQSEQDMKIEHELSELDKKSESEKSEQVTKSESEQSEQDTETESEQSEQDTESETEQSEQDMKSESEQSEHDTESETEQSEQDMKSESEQSEHDISPKAESGSETNKPSSMLDFFGIGVAPPNDAKRWPQVVVSCWKYDIDSRTTAQHEEHSETNVILGASWGRDSRVSFYLTKNDESEFKKCSRDGITLDWDKLYIRLPESLFLEMDEFVTSSSDHLLDSDHWIKTTFTFDNKLRDWDDDCAFRVLVYCYKKGSDGKAILIFGSSVQSTDDSKATIMMAPDRQAIMETHCEGGKFLVDVWRWNTVYGNFEFAELSDEMHLPVK